ncbi:MAG TPA: hypothetical protein VKK79_08790 [Candidatus Lokiarchaeia archaeon]|nr:hypothetical protein [Candidatus Lokiarchaeia archaeon]
MQTESTGPNATQLLEVTIEILGIRKDLTEILGLYGVQSVSELKEKIDLQQLKEHPAYEDFLSAKQLEMDLRETIENARGILAAMEPS